HLTMQVCFEEAWFYEGNGDVELLDLHAESLGVALQGEFACRVECLTGNADQSCQGTHVDDMAVTLASHDRQYRSSDAHRTPKICFENVFRLFQTRFLNHAGMYLSCIVDEKVDAVDVRHHLLDACPHRAVRSDVQPQHVDSVERSRV